MPTRLTRLRQRVTPPRLEVAGAVLVALWVSRNMWLPGRFLSGFDTVAYSGPNLVVTTDAWRAGRLPLWNETIFGGVSHLGNPQAGALYPPKLIALVVDTNQAMGLIVTGHLLLLAVSTVFLMRRLGCRPPAGFAAAAVMTANGAMLTRTIQFEQIIVLAWVPLLLLTITSVMTSTGRARPWRAMAGVTVVTAMTLMAGHPQMTYQAVVVAGVWMVALSWKVRSLQRMVEVGVSAVVGGLVAMPHLVAAVAATNDAAIGLGRDTEQLLAPTQSVAYHNLLRVLWGTVWGVNEAFFAGGFESIGHVGVAATMLAAVGVGVLWSRHERALAAALALLAVLGVVWSMGPSTIVFDAAFAALPGFDLARVSARWLDITAVATAIAVGFAVDGLFERDVRPAVLLPAGVLGGIALLVVATPLEVPEGSTVAVWVAIASVMLALLATRPQWRKGPLLAMVVVLVVGAELAGLSRMTSIDRVSADVAFDDLSAAPSDSLAGEDGLVIAFTDERLGDTPYLVPGFRPNTNTLAGVRSLDGYDGGVQVTDRWVDLIERVGDDPQPDLPIRSSLPTPFEPALAADLAVRWVVLDNGIDPGAQVPGWVATDRRTNEFSIWENPEWRGPAYARATDDPDGPTRPLAVDRRTPERVDVEVGGESEVGETVVLDQQFAPGWTATADGNVVDVFAVDDFFLAARVPAGADTLSLRYRPWWLAPSLVISVVGLALIAAALVAGRRQRGRRETPRATD